MSDEAVVEKADVEKYVEQLKAFAGTLDPHSPLARITLNFLMPIFEGQREEYVGGFELVEERIDQVEAEANYDQKFLDRVIQTIAALGAFADQTLKRGGWADEQGSPLPTCPDDLKMAFAGAQTLVNTLMAEIKEMKDDIADDGAGTDDDAVVPGN